MRCCALRLDQSSRDLAFYAHREEALCDHQRAAAEDEWGAAKESLAAARTSGRELAVAKEAAEGAAAAAAARAKEAAAYVEST